MKASLHTGTLRNGQAYRVEYLSAVDMPIMMQLQEEVIDSLENEDTLQPLSVEEYTKLFSGKGFVIGVFVEEKLIALRGMLEPPMDEEHFGLDAGLPEEELSKVIYQEISCVDPAFRGNRLQQVMGQVVMQELDTDRFRYVCATVAPFNIPSLKDKLSLGLEIVALKEKYEGKLRYVFMKELKLNKRSFEEKMLVPMGNIEEQQHLLCTHYLGAGIKEIDGVWYVQYEKRTNEQG